MANNLINTDVLLSPPFCAFRCAPFSPLGRPHDKKLISETTEIPQRKRKIKSLLAPGPRSQTLADLDIKHAIELRNKTLDTGSSTGYDPLKFIDK